MLFSRLVDGVAVVVAADDDGVADDGGTLLFIIDSVEATLSQCTIAVDRFDDFSFLDLADVDAFVLLFFGLNGAFWNTIAKPLGDGRSSAPCTARQRRNIVRPMINLKILQSVW